MVDADDWAGAASGGAGDEDLPPLVSVIIPTHGRPAFLAQAIDSVLRQTYRHLELIVVDDAGPAPVDVPDDPRARVVVRATTGGPGAARNAGLEVARGELVVFLDDDDVLTPRRLELAVTEIGTAEAHAAAVELFDSTGQSRPAPTGCFEGDMRRVVNRRPQPSMGQVVHRRRNVVPFDETLRLAEDTDWWIRMSGSAVFAWSNEVGLRVRVHDGPRPGVHETTRFDARVEIARRYRTQLDRQALARRRSAVAGQALLIGRRAQALKWAALSLISWPSMLAAKQLVRAALPAGRSKG